MKITSLALSAIIALGTLSAQASFEENARRYLSAQELTESLLQYFPQNTSDCKEVGATNSSMLGVSSAISGNPIAPSPTQSTVQWVVGCISKSFEYTLFEYAKRASVQNLLGPEASAFLENVPFSSSQWTPEQIYLHNLTLPWNKWPAEIRTKVISNMVFVLLGSDDVIRDYGLITPDVLRAKLTAWANANSNERFIQVIKGLSINLALRDEFLSY